MITTTQGAKLSAPLHFRSYISPHSRHFEMNKHPNHTKFVEQTVPVIFTTSFGLLFGPVGTFSILRKVSMPSMTFPKTTCFPSRKSQGAVVTKNYISPVRKETKEAEKVVSKNAPGSRSYWDLSWPILSERTIAPRYCHGTAHHR